MVAIRYNSLFKSIITTLKHLHYEVNLHSTHRIKVEIWLCALGFCVLTALSTFSYRKSEQYTYSNWSNKRKVCKHFIKSFKIVTWPSLYCELVMFYRFKFPSIPVQIYIVCLQHKTNGTNVYEIDLTGWNALSQTKHWAKHL